VILIEQIKQRDDFGELIARHFASLLASRNFANDSPKREPPP